jgi:hypothetical protein
MSSREMIPVRRPLLSDAVEKIGRQSLGGLVVGLVWQV